MQPLSLATLPFSQPSSLALRLYYTDIHGTHSSSTLCASPFHLPQRRFTLFETRRINRRALASIFLSPYYNSLVIIITIKIIIIIITRISKSSFYHHYINIISFTIIFDRFSLFLYHWVQTIPITSHKNTIMPPPPSSSLAYISDLRTQYSRLERPLQSECTLPLYQISWHHNGRNYSYNSNKAHWAYNSKKEKRKRKVVLFPYQLHWIPCCTIGHIIAGNS